MEVTNAKVESLNRYQCYVKRYNTACKGASGSTHVINKDLLYAFDLQGLKTLGTEIIGV